MNLFEMEKWNKCEKLAEDSGFKLRSFCKPSMLWEREDCILQIYIDDVFEPLVVPHFLPCPFCGGKPLVSVDVRSFLYKSFGENPYLVTIYCSGEQGEGDYSFLEDKIPGFKPTVCQMHPSTVEYIGFAEAAEAWNQRPGK